MPARLPALLMAALLALILGSAPGRAGEFTDAAGRHVSLPDRIERVMAVNQAAAVFVFALAPKKLVGWPQPLGKGARGYIPKKFASLPVTGRLTGAEPADVAGAVAAWNPDLIVDYGPVTPAEGALVERIERQTRVPTILLDGSIEAIVDDLRDVSVPFGAIDRGFHLARLASDSIDGLRGTLLTSPATKRPRVYYGLGADGLWTGRVGSIASVVIDESGAIDVASLPPAGGAAAAHPVAATAPPVSLIGSGEGERSGELKRVTLAQLLAWNPSVVIAEQKSFYDALKRDPAYAGLAAVREHRVYLAPDRPFGWLDRPAGLNRLLGLDWLSTIFYRRQYADEFLTTARNFYQEFYGVSLSDKALAALLKGTGVPPTATVGIQGLPGIGMYPALQGPPEGAPMPPGRMPLRPTPQSQPRY